MVHVIATIKLVPGRRDDFIVRFKELVPLVLREAGCIEYFPTLDLKTDIDIQEYDENSVVVIERWESMEVLNSHLNAPHMASFRDDTSEAVESVTVRIVTAEI